MKKFLTPLVALMLLLSLCSIPAMAEVTTIVVETPVSMSLVSETDGNYEYRVTANVTVSAGNTEVNLLMFGNRDNSAFVSGDNVMNLTVEEIASDYNIYYIDQKTAGSDGKVSFVVEGNNNTQITLDLEEEKEYRVLVDDVNLGKMATNIGGKLVISMDLTGGRPQNVVIERM